MHTRSVYPLPNAFNLFLNTRSTDVGHGTGESLLLLLSEPTLPKPSHLVGITSLELHHLRSLERVRKRQAEETAFQGTKVDLYHGDAVYDGISANHPLSPGKKESFDSILALDCAYHFNTRHLFLEQSFKKLAPGGRVALADICFSSSALKGTRLKLISSIVRLMPPQNLISDKDYMTAMKNIGYVDVTLEDITPDVYPPFIVFLKSRGVGWWVFGSILQWYTAVEAKFVIVSGSKPI
jgi:SAM-dependent methyltransferase